MRYWRWAHYLGGARCPGLPYLCFMYVDHVWPDLDLEPSLISTIYSISALPYILGAFGVSFGPKLIILRSRQATARNLKAPILTFDLTLTWHVTSFGKFRGCFRIVSSRAFERRVARLSAAIRSRVMTWARLTPPPPSASRGWRNTPATAGLNYVRPSWNTFLLAVRPRTSFCLHIITDKSKNKIGQNGI